MLEHYSCLSPGIKNVMSAKTKAGVLAGFNSTQPFIQIRSDPAILIDELASFLSRSYQETNILAVIIVIVSKATEPNKRQSTELCLDAVLPFIAWIRILFEISH